MSQMKPPFRKREQQPPPAMGTGMPPACRHRRDRTRAGVPKRTLDKEIADARKLFKALAELGGPELVGPANELDPGLYYNLSANRE